MATALGLGVLLLFATPNTGGSFGPRYLFPAIVPISIMCAAGAHRLGCTHSRSTLLGCSVLSLVASAVFCFSVAATTRKQIVADKGLFDYSERKIHGPALVLIDRIGRRPGHWFTRNGIGFENCVLYAHNAGNLTGLVTQFPTRTIYQYSQTGGKPQLRKVVERRIPALQHCAE